jgi:ABC-type branched-subunit amino acid transport system substrate-binding protein/cytochrome c553
LALVSRLAVWLLVLIFIFGLSSIVAAQQTPAEKLGRQIYVRGSGSAKESITAFMGDESMNIPATALPCASCHGEDGAGRSEGGVVPSDIRWETLSKAYGVTHESGRSHPAYTESSLKRAITEGVDPAGNPILVAMPRYRMTEFDLSALVAYMRGLGEVHDPGLTSDTIRIGTVLPLSGPESALGHDIESVLRAYFDEINLQGGIYSRKLELVVVDPGHVQHAMRVGCERLVENGVFALVGGLGGSDDAAAAEFLAEQEVPHVGPLTSSAPSMAAQNRWVFYVLADLRTQSQVLVDFALRQLKLSGRPGAIVYPKDEALLGSVASMREQWKGNPASLSVLSYPSGRMEPDVLVRVLRRRGVRVIFFLGPAREERRFAETAATHGWTPNMLSLGPMAGDDAFLMPDAFRGKVFVSFPVLPPDPGQLREGELADMLQSGKLVLRHPAFQLWAFRAARTLVEGLRLSGRQLSREKLLQSLAGLNDFDPGVGPRIAFGPSRRMGAPGAYVVGIDFARKTFTAGEWLVPATEIVVDGNGIDPKSAPRRDRLGDERASEHK